MQQIKPKLPIIAMQYDGTEVSRDAIANALKNTPYTVSHAFWDNCIEDKLIFDIKRNNLPEEWKGFSIQVNNDDWVVIMPCKTVLVYDDEEFKRRWSLNQFKQP